MSPPSPAPTPLVRHTEAQIRLETPASAPVGLAALAFADDLHGWAAGASVILGTSDGGRTWTRQYDGPDSILELDAVSAAAAWALTSTEALHTEDAGKTWARAGSPPEPLRHVQFVTPSVGWGLAGSSLYRTEDAGQTWQARPAPDLVGAFCFATPEHGWVANAATTSQGMFATTDAGKTWRAASLPAGTEGGGRHTLACARPAAVWDLFNAGAYTRGQGYLLSHSEDGGMTWAPAMQNALGGGNDPTLPPGIPQGLGSFPGVLDVVDSTTAYFSGACDGCDGLRTTTLARTADGSRTWQFITLTGLPGLGATVSFPTPRHGWLLTSSLVSAGRTTSTILVTEDGGQTWTQQYPWPG